MALISWPNCDFFSLNLFSLLALILGPGHIFFTGSDSMYKVSFFDPVFRVRACFFDPGFRDKDISFSGSGLRSRVFLSLVPGSESGGSVISLFPAPIVLITLQYLWCNAAKGAFITGSTMPCGLLVFKLYVALSRGYFCNSKRKLTNTVHFIWLWTIATGSDLLSKHLFKK